MNESKGVYWIRAEQASVILDWILNRGGVVVWGSLDLAAPERQWATPYVGDDGRPSPPPTELADPAPLKVHKTGAEILVVLDREVERLPVSVERAPGGGWRLTQDSSRQVIEAVGAAGDGAYYQFDYQSKEAVIMAPSRTVPLNEWAASLEPVRQSV